MRRSLYQASDINVPVTGYLNTEDAEPGNTITWGSWFDNSAGGERVALTLIPYSSGSDYSGSTVEQSNYRVLAADSEVTAQSVLIQGDYGTFGIAYLGEPSDHIREICGALESYPLLDESDHSELEMEIEQEQWADWGRKDFKRALVIEFGEGLDEILDGLDEGFIAKIDERAAYDERVAPSTRVLNATWYSFASSHGDGGRVFEAPGSCHFYIEDAIKWLRENRDLGAFLVLGNIEYGERATFSVARDAALEGRLDDARKILAMWPDLVLVELTEGDAEAVEEATVCA